METGEPRRRRREWVIRLAWFVGLWLAGVIAVGAVALALRGVLL